MATAPREIVEAVYPVRLALCQRKPFAAGELRGLHLAYRATTFLEPPSIGEGGLCYWDTLTHSPLKYFPLVAATLAQVLVCASAQPPPLQTLTPPLLRQSTFFGEPVAGLNDTDGDGRGDL